MPIQPHFDVFPALSNGRFWPENVPAALSTPGNPLGPPSGPREASLAPRETSLAPREASLGPREASLGPRQASLVPRQGKGKGKSKMLTKVDA